MEPSLEAWTRRGYLFRAVLRIQTNHGVKYISWHRRPSVKHAQWSPHLCFSATERISHCRFWQRAHPNQPLITSSLIFLPVSFTSTPSKKVINEIWLLNHGGVPFPAWWKRVSGEILLHETSLKRTAHTLHMPLNEQQVLTGRGKCENLHKELPFATQATLCVMFNWHFRHEGSFASQTLFERDPVPSVCQGLWGKMHSLFYGGHWISKAKANLLFPKTTEKKSWFMWFIYTRFILGKLIPLWDLVAFSHMQALFFQAGEKSFQKIQI